MEPETWRIQLAATGDEAEAEDEGGALLAAATMLDDAIDAGALHDRKRARQTITISCDGMYKGVSTELARLGRRERLSVDA